MVIHKRIVEDRYVVAVQLPGEDAVPDRDCDAVTREAAAALREFAAALESSLAAEGRER